MTFGRRVFLLCAALTVGCATGCAPISTNFDFDQSWDFSSLSTFQLLTPPGSPTGNPADPGDPLTEGRVMNALRTVLAEKGYREVDADPDFSVAFHVGSEDKIEVANWGYAYGQRGAYWGAGGAAVDVYQYQEGTLVVDIVDAKSQRLIWRGTARKVLDANPTPEQRTKNVDAAVAKILKDFPPEMPEAK